MEPSHLWLKDLVCVSNLSASGQIGQLGPAPPAVKPEGIKSKLLAFLRVDVEPMERARTRRRVRAFAPTIAAVRRAFYPEVGRNVGRAELARIKPLNT